MGNKRIKVEKGTNEVPVLKSVADIVDVLSEDVRPFQITEAAIVDDFCNYTYEITKGIGIGDSVKVKAKSGTIEDDMRNAFAAMNVHLAVVDDIFKHSSVEIDDIDKFHGHELATLFTVTGFKISGSDEDESIILIGNKYVSAGGRIAIATPKIPLDHLSSYKYYNELKGASVKAREEVALYKEGKYIPVKVEEEAEDPKQTKMQFEQPLDDQEKDAIDEIFEKATV